MFAKKRKGEGLQFPEYFRIFHRRVPCPQVGGVAEKDLRTLVDFMYHGELEVMMIELFISIP